MDGGEGGGGDAALQSNLEDDLTAMGFADPVTKEQAGRRYHKELARQVCAPKSHRDKPSMCAVQTSMLIQASRWHACVNVTKALDTTPGRICAGRIVVMVGVLCLPHMVGGAP